MQCLGHGRQRPEAWLMKAGPQSDWHKLGLLLALLVGLKNVLLGQRQPKGVAYRVGGH